MKSLTTAQERLLAAHDAFRVAQNNLMDAINAGGSIKAGSPAQIAYAKAEKELFEAGLALRELESSDVPRN